MAERSPSAAGWYPDPLDARRLHHWGGKCWDGRHRSWPAWALHADEVLIDAPVAEGPVHTPVLPSAAGVHAPVRTSPLSGARAAPGPVEPFRGRPHHPEASFTRSAPRPSHRPLTVFSALVAGALLMMALTVTVTRPGGYVDVLANDSAFVQRANAACGPGLRSVSRSDRATPGGLPVMATATSAATVDRDADTVAAIGGRLAAIPVTPAAGAAVAGWLAGWSRYAMGLHQVASYLRSHAEGPPPAQLVDQTTAQAAQIDGFALSNGIWACTLLPADRSPAGTGA